ncbi:MAG: hypothetical protein NVSMB55_27440 [Mycobacteriales bacterium]
MRQHGLRRFAAGIPALLVLLVGCGGGSAAGSAAGAGATPATGGTAAVAVPVPTPTCPPPAQTRYVWPAAVPADLPRLPAATLTSSRQLPSGLIVVQFTTATSLRAGVIFLVRALPAAGYTLGRGDAEPAEADAPFAKLGLRGVLRGSVVTGCRTQWVLALARQSTLGGSPLLPTRPHPSPSPLPFG